MWFWLLKWVLLGPVVRWYARPTVVGDLPKDGPVIVAANHLTEIDSFVLCLVLIRKPRFVAKSEYFEGGGLRGRAERWLMKVTGQIPVDRSGGDAAAVALDAAERVLRDGGVWAIYPEGTRSPDGRLHRGHTGAMRVAQRVPEAKVVPVGIVGTRAVDVPGRNGWRRGRVRVTIGGTLDVPRADCREATDALMDAIGALSGQERVDRYSHRSGA
ncbi:1-acyl-sn-glycerol-3-phosphate acyltransferase [Nocardioides albertanoniae]|uniref:1-acyl-sn-glycerol-3-phosphate acyltransferase n=1 Tax=Nocardioides albertanoniae TaxID=1175486 RepID=A0A543A555_9ACTN|nr:lysophospholipid acyltransferase family protein [Nocardioides albertanoniae]TQL67688.1 1-acyl-sn-glycerol-3-phosphate acyltransferase [Nocardioides albertanoniae]